MFLSSHNHERRRELVAEPFPEEWQSYLDENVILYRLLSEAEQVKLRNSLRIFAAEKSWEGCAGFQITDEVRVTVAGQACLLVLGFEDYYFDELQTVLVYPGGFLAPAPDPFGTGIEDRVVSHLGEAHWRGPVILSWWQAQWAGRRLGRRNLVLHEFAHKLAELGDPISGMPPMEDANLADRWVAVMDAEYARHAEDAAYARPSLLDHYGAKNRAEFFAVVSESFFLQPIALRERHPQLYQVLAEFYRQDPAARRFDPELVGLAEDADEEYARHVIAECSTAIRLRPDYVDVYRQRAAWYSHLGEFDSALKDCTTRIQLATKPERAEAYYERGSVHWAAGHYDLAIADFSEAIRRFPDFAAAYRDRGAVFAAKGELKHAFADLTRALRLDPKDDRAYIDRALAYYDARKYQKAIRDLTRAIGLAPFTAMAYCHRALVHLAMEEYDQATSDCNQALHLDPHLPVPYKHRGVAHLRMGAYDQAIAVRSQLP